MELIEGIRQKMRHNPIYRKKVINMMINTGVFLFIIIASLLFLFGR